MIGERMIDERMIEIVQNHFGLTAEDSFPAPKWYFQQMSWVQSPWHPENFAYNYPLALRMRGPLDRSALEGSFQEIVSRHQPLRSVFRIMEDRLIQIVLPPQPLPLPVVDLSNVCEAEREAEILRLAVADANRPFDLSQGPLLRAKLWRLGPEDHLLLLTTHHIVSSFFSRTTISPRRGFLPIRRLRATGAATVRASGVGIRCLLEGAAGRQRQFPPRTSGPSPTAESGISRSARTPDSGSELDGFPEDLEPERKS